jgi:predicted TIM-barrel fold metal-dependent hydrolase
MDTKDKDLALATVQAYNDWHIEGWCGAYPGRFIPNAIPAIWDAELLAGEVHRVAKKGCRAITMPELPHLLGLPSYHTDWWDPFWNAVSDEDFTVNLHIGQGFAAITTAPEAPIETLLVLSTQVSVIAAQDLLWGPVFRKYPNVKVAWSEGGIGWIPFFLDRCDRTYINQTWAGQDFGGKLPSEVFRDHSLACYVTDPSSLYNRERIGMDIIAWEADYPHSDCLWPDAPEQVMAELTAAGCNDQEIEKITWQNTARFMRFDPFAVIPKERATVGALRALDPNVDTAVHSRAEWKRMYAEKQVASV